MTLYNKCKKNKNKEFINKVEDINLDNMHLSTIGDTSHLRGGGGAPLRDQFGNVVAGRSPDRNHHLLRSNIGTPNSSWGTRSNIGTPVIINSGNGVNTINAHNPFIIPGVSPTPTSIVYTNYPQFGDGQPISGESLILPGGQPFVPSPSVFLSGSQSLPNLHIANMSNAIGNEQSPVRQRIPDFIKVGSGVIPGTSYGITNENYLKYKQAKEENDKLNELEYSKYKK